MGVSRPFPRSVYSTQMSEPFSDEEQPRFGISRNVVKFGQPDTETETEDQFEKPTKKKTNRRKKYEIIKAWNKNKKYTKGYFIKVKGDIKQDIFKGSYFIGMEFFFNTQLFYKDKK